MHFEEQWDLRSLQICSHGIVLLKAFARAHPEAYKFVQRSDFNDPLLSPAFAAITEWEAFGQHVQACPQCLK